MAEIENLESVLKNIADPACRSVAQQTLKVAHKALDMSKGSRNQFFIDEIEKIMPKALKLRTKNEAE